MSGNRSADQHPVGEGKAHASVFSRIRKNIGWLAGARGFIGVLSIAYLAIAARALGPREFGEFALVLTYGQMIANLVQFQSWKGVIRFGALHLARDKQARLARLFGFTATLDAASAIIGAAFAVLGVHVAGPLLHWSAGVQAPAAIFATVILLASGGTPSGMLRLFDRFDLQAYTEATGPVIRLGGSIGAWALGGGILSFLAVWGVAALSQTIAQWVAAVGIHGSRLAFGRRAFAKTLKENHRLWRFMLQTNISNSLSLFWMQLGTLAVGAVAGPVEAGGFRIADRIAKGIAKPVETVTRALYPELARLIATDNHATVRKVLIQVTGIATGLALIVILVAGFGGSEILHVLAGKQFEFARVFLFLLSVAAAIELAGFALEPFHSAHGRAGRILRSRIVGAIFYMLLLGVLLPTRGGNGAAIASIGASLVMFIQLALSAAEILRKYALNLVPAKSSTHD
jgi:O-antigen/teichoic acid export membrane protein